MAENFNIIQEQQQIIEQQTRIIQQQQETIRKTTQMSHQSQTQRIERQIQALMKSLACVRTEQNSDHKKIMKLISEVNKIKEEDSIFMSQASPELDPPTESDVNLGREGEKNIQDTFNL